MKKKMGLKAFLMGLITIFATILLIYNAPYRDIPVYHNNYIVDTLCFCFSMLLLFWYSAGKKFDIFDPIYFISLIYFMMYFITPMYDLSIGEIYWFGYDLFPHGIKATVIAFIGYLSFFVFYTGNILPKKIVKVEEKEKQDEPAANNQLIIIILAMYVVCFVANVWYLMKSGGYGDLLYLLTMGMMGSSGSGSGKVEAIGFVSMLSYSLPTVTMLYWEYGKSKFWKIALFVPMLMLQVTRGFRFFVIQIAISFMAFYYIRKNKRPNAVTIVILFIIILIPTMLMTTSRVNVRSGTGVNTEALAQQDTEEVFEDTIWDNLRIYKNFYGMVDEIPQNYDYVYGRQIVTGSLVMMIPRAIWPGKISSYGGVGLATLIGGRLDGTGQAYPTVGEYYYSFGTLGVIFYMAIYALWMGKYKRRKMGSQDELDVIEFALMLGCNLQLIIRGYFPSNFWLLVFTLIPIWVCKYLRKNRG